MTDLLTTYQRQGENRKWDDFRAKIPSNLLKLWGDLIIECRRNGFVGPRSEGDKIIWRQVIGTNDIKNGDLCTMCDRGCSKREKIDSGEAKRLKFLNNDYQQEKKCWMEVLDKLITQVDNLADLNIMNSQFLITQGPENKD